MEEIRLTAPVIISSKSATDGGSESRVIQQAGQVPIVRGNRRFWLDGSVVLDDLCVRRTSDLEFVVPHAAAHWPVDLIAEWWANSAKNPGALYIEDTTESWSACLPDPLGGAVTFYLEQSGQAFISTSNVELVNAAERSGLRIEKDPHFQIERLLLGNGGLTASSYANVQSVEPFQYLVLIGAQVQIHKYKILDQYSSMSLFEVFTTLRNDVLSSVNAIANSGAEQVISHLTGGFDSRLVLSAVLNLGLNDKIDLFCSGPDGSTDRVIADGLTRRFSLRRTNGAGLTTAPTNNMSERLMGALFASGGITNTGPHGREVSVNAAAMGGGYGEVLRTFYGNRVIHSNGKLDKNLLVSSFLPSARNKNSYVSELAVQDVSAKLLTKFEFLEDSYASTDFVADAFYTHVRNRYHIGQTSLLWSRIGSRFDPLYSVAGFELGRRTTQNSRMSNVVGFDLMDSMFSDLLAQPFDYDRFNEALRDFRRPPEPLAWPAKDTSINFEKALSPSTTETSPFLQTLSRISAKEPVLTPADRRAKTLEANKMGVSFWQIVYKNTGKELLASAYEQTRGSQIYDLVDSSYVEKLITSNAMTKKQLRDLYSLGGILTWLSFG
ncbi:hypothetical protein [Glutamicibacter sp. AOP33-2CA-4]|uniref:hypothetical protein n=1 Tax=Glutamicibacter sp. AOP33-2CA-4 TaxID=3457690 RepID=UPI00403496FD